MSPCIFSAPIATRSSRRLDQLHQAWGGGRHLTGFHLAGQYPELVIRPIVEKYGGIWREDAPVVVDGNLISSRHPDDMGHYFSTAIRDWLARR
jgi:putative intracellular protease/amidase